MSFVRRLQARAQCTCKCYAKRVYLRYKGDMPIKKASVQNDAQATLHQRDCIHSRDIDRYNNLTITNADTLHRSFLRQCFEVVSHLIKTASQNAMRYRLNYSLVTIEGVTHQFSIKENCL